MNMNTADRQVIAMVNAPHERRAREAAERQKKLQARPIRRMKRKKRDAAVCAFLWLIVRLELYVIAGGLMFAATAFGWVAADIGIIGTICCIAGGFMELWRHERRRSNV